ncbi:MAG TPA: hypothetical protein VLW88_05715 [Hyphomicrobium sp.]|nr:hypothetical protein [Hyphomicrobium sp.]
MAKAKKTKTKSRIRSKVKLAKVKPTYMRPGTSFKLGLHDVVRALKVIEESEQLDKFVKAAKRSRASVMIDARTVNFVKDFMVDNNMHEHPVGQHIVNAIVPQSTRDRFRPCNFGS